MGRAVEGEEEVRGKLTHECIFNGSEAARKPAAGAGGN